MGMFGLGRWRIMAVEQSLAEGELTDPELSTGDSEDDQVLRAIARASRLDQPREWTHFLPCASESAARVVGRIAADVGFTVEITTNRRGKDWCILAGQSDVVISAALVRRTREFFQGVAERVPGASYDGWHASV